MRDLVLLVYYDFIFAFPNLSAPLNTGVTISLQQHEYTVDEDEGTVHVCAEITGETERNVTVYLHVEEYTALGMCMYIWTHTKCNLTSANHSIPMPTADVDYTASEVTTLLFLPGDATPQCAYITILDDTILEYTEHFSVHLDTTDDDVKFGYKYATVNITDDDCKFCNVTVKVSRYCTIDLMHKH